MKYYTLILNNCYDTDIHYVSTKRFSCIPGVLEKKYTRLENVKEEFMELDDTIELQDDGWVVKGSFPVFGVMENDIMYDVITGKEIKYSDENISGLSYREKNVANLEMLLLLLTLLDEDSKKRYEEGLNLIEFSQEKEESYNYTIVNNNKLTPSKLITRTINNQEIEIITGEKIYKISNDKKHDIITTRLSYIDKTPADKDIAMELQACILYKSTYLKRLSKEKNEAIRKYNNYLILNNDRNYGEKKLKREK